jgi:hypothetical protein
MNKTIHITVAWVILIAVFSGCNEPEPISRCVIDRVEVLEIDPDYYNDDPDEGNPDLYVEFIEAETQTIRFTSGVAQNAQLPVDLDFVAVNIEEVDFGTPFGFTVFDADDATTQDFIALDLPFLVNDHLDAQRTEVDIADGPTIIRVHLIWY